MWFIFYYLILSANGKGRRHILGPTSVVSCLFSFSPVYHTSYWVQGLAQNPHIIKSSTVIHNLIIHNEVHFPVLFPYSRAFKNNIYVNVQQGFAIFNIQGFLKYIFDIKIRNLQLKAHSLHSWGIFLVQILCFLRRTDIWAPAVSQSPHSYLLGAHWWVFAWLD